MFVIGTAGHVDHGKSTLVHALSGINPDRLAEEQEREMTIDLGFAWVRLPIGEVSIVDVPGHEDLIKNMLAGIGGIDAVMFVVAADEGIMPQTREHLAIIDLLQIPRGVVALTKCDLIDDPDWIDLVVEELREELAGTVLEDCAIVPVSAHTGQGLDDLTAELSRLLSEATIRPDRGRPRMPIDRAFVISGFGTIVTGTLTGGSLRVGEQVRILPGGLQARIRGLQSHKAQVDTAGPGSRVAANLTGVAASDISRGQVLLSERWLIEPSRLLDVELQALGDLDRGLQHSERVDLHVGSARVLARLRLLEGAELSPGQVAWAQLRLDSPVAVARGDRYIVRQPSPSVTLGGGVIVDPQPIRRHRRFDEAVFARLEAMRHGSAADLLLLAFGEGVSSLGDAFHQSGLDHDTAQVALGEVLSDGQLTLLDEGESGVQSLACPRPVLQRLLEGLTGALDEYHANFGLRLGMPKEDLRSRLGASPRAFAALLGYAAREGLVDDLGRAVCRHGFEVTLTREQSLKVSAALQAYEQEPFTPPSASQATAMLGADLLQYLLDRGELVRASDEVLFGASAYGELKRVLVEYLKVNGSITVAQFRDTTGASRRYALGFLEAMDRIRVTRRLQDKRVLRTG